MSGRPVQPSESVPVQRLVLALLLSVCAGAVQAAETRSSYRMTLAGLTVGSLDIAGEENGRSYAVSTAIRSRNLAGILAPVRYTPRARGRLARSSGVTQFEPSSSREDSTGARPRLSELNWINSTPEVTEYKAEGPQGQTPASPAAQLGARDPATMLWALFRPVSETDVCRSGGRVFDGYRAAVVEFAPPQVSGATRTCTGLYRRTAGWTAERMAKRPTNRMEAIYDQRSDGLWQITRLTLDTRFGPLRLIRQ